MQFIAGLGNPGTQYQQTRHNVGWQILDAIQAEVGAPAFQNQAAFKAEVSKTSDLVLIKPQTFMNASGDAVRAVVAFYSGQAAMAAKSFDNVFVVHDDLDLELGTFKLQFGVGPKVHNGLLSVDQQLGTDQYWHVRIGVDNRQGDRQLAGSEYVLQPFTADELAVLEQTIPQVVAAISARLGTIQ